MSSHHRRPRVPLAAFGLLLAAGCMSTPEPKSPEPTNVTTSNAPTSPPADPEASAAANDGVSALPEVDPPKPAGQLVAVMALKAPEGDLSDRDAADASRVLESIRGDFVACARKRAPRASVSATLEIDIGNEGQVLSADAKSEDGIDDGVRQCIVERIERAKFEPPHGVAILHVRAPLRIVPPGGE